MKGRMGRLAKFLSIPVLAVCGFVVAATLAGGGLAGTPSSSPSPTPSPSTGPPTSPAPTTPPPTLTPTPTPTIPPTPTTTTAPPPRFEGCSHGFWKNHTKKWSGYSPYQKVKSVFTAAPPTVKNLTLLEGLKLGGGGAKALTRQAIAALLNAAHPEVDYPLPTAQVVSMVNAAFASGNDAQIESLKNTLDHFNNLGASGFCS